MQFKGKAIPAISVGVDFTDEEDLLQPDQGLSLKDILERFTRGEALPVGKNGTFGSDDEHEVFSVDLEKLMYADLVDKSAYYDKLTEIRKKANEEDIARQKAQRQAQADETEKLIQKRIRIEARKLAKGNLAKSA